MKILLLPAFAALLFADGPGVILSKYAENDFALTADPSAPQWKGVQGVFADRGPRGESLPASRTEIRSRWTNRNLYFLFICPYETLHLKSDPSREQETNKLWNWDVAEVFVGTDFNHIQQYKEFEMSPQGEWVDLDIDRDQPKPEGGWLWSSGFKVLARVLPHKKIWYGEMQIPIEKIDSRRPEAGREMRINFYRCEGAPPNRKYIAWQPTNSSSFHVPEAFGRLKLVR